MTEQRRSMMARALWAACLLGAGVNHARILIEHGILWDYGVGGPSAAYWTSLTVLDPMVALLLFLRPKVGVVGTIALITTNVAHNLAITAAYAPPGGFLEAVTSDIWIICQVAFLLFVAATARIAWRGVSDQTRNRIEEL